jgi:SpoVK/Ycf46/Vps4 family AAA+-type ATPase
MHRKRASGGQVQELSPIVRLWIWRMLMKLDMHKSFIQFDPTLEDSVEVEFSDDEVAEALGLKDAESNVFEEDLSDGKRIAKKIHTKLRALWQEVEKQCGEAEAPGEMRQNVDRLAALVGLSELDCRILEFVVLVRTESLLHDMAVRANNLSFVKLCRALAAILDAPEEDIRAALDSRGSLLRSGLLKIDSDVMNYDLTDKVALVSRHFADRILTGNAEPLDLLRDMVCVAPAPELGLEDYAHVRETLDIALPYLRQACETGRRGVNIFIHGQPGTGKTQLARVLAAALGRELFEVATEDEDGDLIGGTARLNAYRAAQSCFGQRRALVVFDEAEEVFKGENHLAFLFGSSKNKRGRDGKGALNRMLEENPAPTIWLSNVVWGVDPAFLRRFDIVMELPIPPRSQRQRVVEEACAGLVDAAGIARIAEAEHLAPAVVTRAASVVRAIGDRFDAPARARAVECLIGNTLEAQGRAAIKRNDPTHLPEVYDPAFIRADADMGEIAEGLRASRAARICLYGPPGTGKTAYARWLAGRLDMPLVVKRGSDLISKWVGETEQNIARAFRQTERENALLLIDEVDGFLQDRRGAHHSWEVSSVNEMLTQMEAFSGVFVASTNLMDGLDQAALRRFDLKAKFDYLAPNQAAALLRRHCESLGLAAPGAEEDVALQRLRKLTPGDFAAVLRQHRFRPIRSAWQMVEMLRAECAVKEGGQANAIGFTH